MRVEGFGKRYREKTTKISPGAKLTQRIVGKKIVIRYADDGYQINPEGSGTKGLDPNVEQSIISMLAFPLNGGFPKPLEELVRSGVPITFEGF